MSRRRMYACMHRPLTTSEKKHLEENWDWYEIVEFSARPIPFDSEMYTLKRAEALRLATVLREEIELGNGANILIGNDGVFVAILATMIDMNDLSTIGVMEYSDKDGVVVAMLHPRNSSIGDIRTVGWDVCSER